jgi:bacillithiol biosynthesis cysteine-adding enzyme BshC
MSGFQIDFSQLFSTTKLFSDYLGGGLERFYRYSFSNAQDTAAAADSISSRKCDRERLHEIVYEANKPLNPSDQTSANIELLKKNDTLCVFAGQQAGFCATPMYIIYKALTAVKLAKHYEKLLNRPVVPCFWIATDDHDFEEVRNANFLLRNGELAKVTYNPEQEPAGSPIADIALDDGVHDFCRAVDDALIDTEFKKPTLEIFKSYYKPGVRLSEAFAKVLNYFIGKWGIILVDPNFQGMKELFKPIFAREILEHQHTFGLYKERSDELLHNGYHAQVHKTGENLNLFYNEGKRLNLIIDGNKFYTEESDHRYSLDDLAGLVERFPERFSTNVLLRPLAQCAAFPTLAQVVGPSELAYYAQIPFPVIYPRHGMTIVEPHIKKIIHKYDLDPGDLKNRLEALIGEVVERLFPSEAAGTIGSLSDCLKTDLDNFADKLKNADPDGYQHIVNFKKHVDYELKQLQKKLKASNKKRHDSLADQIRKANAFLFPENKLQERVLSPLYFANKYSLEIFDKIYESLQIDKPAHIILEL